MSKKKENLIIKYLETNPKLVHQSACAAFIPCRWTVSHKEGCIPFAKQIEHVIYTQFDEKSLYNIFWTILFRMFPHSSAITVK